MLTQHLFYRNNCLVTLFISGKGSIKMKMSRRMAFAAVACFAAGTCLLSNIALAAEPAGTISWLHYGGSSERDAAQVMCGMPDGSFYVSGWYESIFDVTLNINTRNFGLRDIYLAKYNPQGNLLWVQTGGSSHCDQSGGVDALPDGTCVIAGSYGFGTKYATFGFGQPNYAILPGFGNYDVCIVKYAASGEMLWAKHAESDDFDFARCVAMSPDGGVYVAGYYTGSAMYFARELPEQFVMNEVNGAGNDYFLARYDSNGNFQWAKPLYCADVIALADGTCVASTSPGIVRFAADGTEMYHDDGLCPYGASMAPLGDNEFAMAYALGSSQSRVGRYSAQTSSFATQWEVEVPANLLNAPISARPEGSLIVAAEGTLWSFTSDGSQHFKGDLGFSCSGVFAVPGQEYCFLVSNFHSDTQAGPYSLTPRGSGDYFMAKASTRGRYQVVPVCGEGGQINFHRANNLYWEGEQATLTACAVFPNSVRFVGWGGDFEGQTDPTITFVVDGDRQAVATFELLEGATLPVASGGALACLAGLMGAVLIKRVRKYQKP